MSQFSIILSSKYDSLGRGGSFTNELPQPLNFALNKNEKWRMSLAELTYHPAAIYNIRKTNSDIKLIITDFAILTWVKKKIFYLSWEFVKEPQHVFQPGVIKKYFTWTKTIFGVPGELSEFIDTLPMIPMRGDLPGNASHFANFKPENRDKPCLRLYLCKSIKWREDLISPSDLGLIEIPLPNNVEAEFEIWDSEYNKKPETKMYKFHLNFQAHDKYRTNHAPYSMETLLATTTWGVSSEWTEDEYKPRKKKKRSIEAPKRDKSKGVDDYRSQMSIRSKTLTIHIPEGHYSDRSFVDVFNTTVNKGLEELYGSSTRQMGVNEWPVHYAGPLNPPMFFLGFEEIQKDSRHQSYYRLNIDDDYHKATKLSLKINRELQHLMGMTKYIADDYGIISWPAKKNVRAADGNARHELTYYRTTFPYPCAMRTNRVTKFYLFCDICEPMIVNDQRCQLLRMVGSTDEGATANPANHITFPLQYRKICKSLVTSIKVWMQEELFSRQEINIVSDVYVKLVFQQIV